MMRSRCLLSLQLYKHTGVKSFNWEERNSVRAALLEPAQVCHRKAAASTHASTTHSPTVWCWPVHVQPSTPDEREAVHLASLKKTKNTFPQEDPLGTVAFQPTWPTALLVGVIGSSAAGGCSAIASVMNIEGHEACQYPLHKKTDFSGDSPQKQAHFL